MVPANTVISSGAACRYGADGKRIDDTLSREISHRNAARTIRGGDFSTPLRFGRNDGRARAGFFYNLRRSRYHNPRPERPSNLRTLRPIGPVNLKNLPLLNLHTEGVSKGARRHRHLERRIYEKIVSRCFIVPPLRGGEGGAVRHQRGESHRRWLIDVMLIMLYDTESKSRNADFILIARRAIPQPSGPKAPSNLRTLRPIGPVNPKNLPPEPSEPSRQRRTL